MKIRMASLVLALVAATAFGQDSDPPWQIVRYPDLSETTVSQINAVIARRYVPVGMDITANEGVRILFARDESVNVYDWLIKEFAEIESLQADFTGTITQGWLPMDITISEGIVIGLFIHTDATVAGWRIGVSALNTTEASNAQAALREAGYSPWGVAFTGGTQLWHLGVAFADEPALPTVLAGFAADANTAALAQSITDISADQWRPWGLTRAEDEILIHFIPR